jgi:ubiquinone/menaquinone biosynthesis C-methylase UbiE
MAGRRSVPRIWHTLVTLGFRLLYNELAVLYDPVSWIASLGRWRDWQRTVLDYLPKEGRVLEVGCGPGHLQMDLNTASYKSVGLDLSLAMLQQARQGVQRLGLTVSLCQGSAFAVPFAQHAFDAIVCTFPTSYVYEKAWMEEVVRLLKDGGILVVAEMASFSTRAPHSRALEWLYRVTGQRDPAPDLPKMLRDAGLSAWREEVEVNGSIVALALGCKRR